MNRVTQRTYDAEDRPGGSHGTILHDLREVRQRASALDRGRPFVTLAYAQSLDGSITTRRGRRYALSGPESLRFTHVLRAEHDAILVGVGTVLADDPELRVRLVDGPSPRPVIVDSRLRTPPGSKLLGQLGRSPLIATTERADRDHPHRRSGIVARGSRILPSPALPNGWVDLSALLRDLQAEGIRHVMVEGGARIITSFLGAGLVDYAVITVAPIFLGGLSAIEKPGLADLHGDGADRAVRAVPRLGRVITSRLGDDLIIGGELAPQPPASLANELPATVVTPLVPDAGWPGE